MRKYIGTYVCMKRITITSIVTQLFIICAVILILSAKGCDSCFSPPVMMLKLMASGLVVFIGSIYFRLQYLRTEKIIFDVETAPLLETNEATTDIPFSGEGIVKPIHGKVLTAPYTKQPCVYYHSITEERKRLGKSSNWKVIENKVQFVPFHFADERGAITVDLTNIDQDFSNVDMSNKDPRRPDPSLSEIDCEQVLKHAYVGKDYVRSSFLGLGELKRRSEYILRPDTNIFVYGYVSKKNNELVIHEHPLHPLLISRKPKEQYVAEFYKGGNVIFFAHVLASLGFTIVLYSLQYFVHIPHSEFFILLISGNACISGSIVFSMYNRIVTLRERARNALSNIDIELGRRNTIIPQILELIKHYTAHEKDVIESLVVLRKTMEKEQQTSIPLTNVSPLFAVLEAYPKLKAQTNYESLMITLVDTEERIAYSRAFYNRNVRKYNTLISQFPFNLIAIITEMKEMKFVQIVAPT